MSDVYYRTDTSVGWPIKPAFKMVLRIQLGYKQKPYISSKPLAYNRTYRQLTDFGQLFPLNPAEPFDAASCGPSSYLDSTLHTSSPQYIAAHGKAWAKLVGDSKDPRAAIGVSLAEGREAIAMIVERATKLGKAFRALKQGNLRKFLQELGTRPLNKHKDTRWTRPKDASALWLEYWLGWAPAVGDIYNAIDVLQRDHWPELALKGVGTSKIQGSYRANGAFAYEWWTCEGRLLVRLGCKVQVSNPNLYLANLLGLVNPVSVAWAVVPFSFIVGWFSNVQQVLDSYTDFVGLTILPNTSYTTCYAHASGDLYRWDYPTSPPMYWKGKTSSWMGHTTMRNTSLTRPSLRAWVPAGLSPSRGATAIALLVSIFTKG